MTLEHDATPPFEVIASRETGREGSLSLRRDRVRGQFELYRGAIARRQYGERRGDGGSGKRASCEGAACEGAARER